jgi:hypothetical protein
MNEENSKENFKAAEEILKGIKIPGKKDSMLAAAKLNHVQRIGVLLNDTLVDTRLSQSEINEVVTEFKEKYENTFLKFIQKEG